MHRQVAILDNSLFRFLVERSIPVSHIDYLSQKTVMVCPPLVYDKEVGRKVPFLYRNFINKFGENWYGVLSSVEGTTAEALMERIDATASEVDGLLTKLNQHLAIEDLEVCATGIVLSESMPCTLISDDSDVLFWFHLLASMFGWKPMVLSSVEWLGQVDRYYLNGVIESCLQHYHRAVQPGVMRTSALMENATTLEDGIRHFTSKGFSACHPRMRSQREVREAGQFRRVGAT